MRTKIRNLCPFAARLPRVELGVRSTNQSPTNPRDVVHPAWQRYDRIDVGYGRVPLQANDGHHPILIMVREIRKAAAMRQREQRSTDISREHFASAGSYVREHQRIRGAQDEECDVVVVDPG